MADEKRIPIPGRVYNAAVGGHVAGAEDIVDDALDKTQREINEEVVGESASSMKNVLSSIDAVFQTSGGDADITADPADVVVGGGEIPTVNAVRGAVDVGSTFLNNKKVSELDIDAEPTVGSKNLVESGGVYDVKLDYLNRISEDYPYISKTYLITASGTFGSNTGYSHAVVPVVEGECYLLTNNHNSNDTLRYVFAKSEEVLDERKIDIVDDTTVYVVNHGQTDVITIPTGCNFLFFNSLPETTYPLTFKKVRDMSKAMDMQAIELTGAGNAIMTSQDIYNVKVGNKYRVWVKNPSISLEGISYSTSAYVRFAIRCCDINNTSLGYVINVGLNTTTPLESYYDFTPIDGTEYIKITMRAGSGAKQVFVLEDITNISVLERTLPRITFEGTYTNQYPGTVGTDSFGSFLAGHTYRLWLKDISVFPQISGGVVFSVWAYNNPNKDYESIGCARVHMEPTAYGTTIQPYYDFELPTSVEKEEGGETVTIDVKEWWFVVINRVKKGNTLDIRIEDITYVNSCKVEVIDSLESESATSALSAKQGKMLKDEANELSLDVYGGTIIESKIGKDELDKEEVNGTFSITKWLYGTSKTLSYKIPLSQYIEDGYTHIHFTPKEEYATYYVFTKAELPPNDVSNSVLKSTYLSDAMRNEIRLKIDANNGDTRIQIPADNTLYLYIIRHFATSDYYNTPVDYSITKENEHQSIIDEKIESSVGKTLSIAVKPIPPTLINIKINSDGSITKEDNVLTSGIIFGNFTCKLKEGYAINRVILVDTAGNIVDYNYATENLPPSVMDSSGNNTGTTNRSVFGAGLTLFEYGLILEVISDPSNIGKETSSVFEYFFWSDDLTSELATLPRFNGESYTDSSNDDERVYTKASIESALQRVKIAAMIPWEPLRYVMPTQSSYRDIRFNQGTLLYGIPYSRANVRDRWFGICVSPETFLTATKNPYSVLYTEKIGNNTIDCPFASEYGITSYGSTHGVPYYGLVCSAYASYVLGFDEAIATDAFPQTSRMYIFSKHSGVQSGAGIVASPVDAHTIPALSTITTPGHTYLVVDFYVINGERVAALVAEETSPMIRVRFYPIDRLQERFDYEYNYYCTADGGADISDSAKIIETNVAKPSQLDSRKDNNVWDVSNLYSTQTEKELLLGVCKPDIHVDEHIMFYMGDKAVVMEYDASVEKNDRQWLIVSPEEYTKIKIEKWDESNSQWSVITSNYDIDSHKESYSDNNENYFKVDVTEQCPTYGKYRACLVDDNNEQTGYTQWIVLNCLIKKDPNDATKIIWETSNDSLSSESDVYATAVSAGFVNSAGVGSTATFEGNVTTRHYVEVTQSHANYVKVRLKCKWGCATRYVSYSSL